jgi:hypothetical protein
MTSDEVRYFVSMINDKINNMAESAYRKGFKDGISVVMKMIIN